MNTDMSDAIHEWIKDTLKKWVPKVLIWETKETMKEIDVIQKGISHRPFNEKSEDHQQFLQNLSSKKEKIQEQFPFINF